MLKTPWSLLSTKPGFMGLGRAMRVAEDSPLRNPEQIPYPTPPPPVQSQAGAVDEEDTPMMRELVRVIATHVETVDL